MMRTMVGDRNRSEYEIGDVSVIRNSTQRQA